MIDTFAKEYLHSDLREARRALLWKLDGLSEYDVRRPMTITGTNLLGLVKHLTRTEAQYLGQVFGRAFPEDLPWAATDAELDADKWATENESRSEVIDRYSRVCAHSDKTISELPIDADGHVAHWPRPDVMLFNIMVHVLSETLRHAGHADILLGPARSIHEDAPAAIGVTAQHEGRNALERILAVDLAIPKPR
jgi:hypothetical protein